MKLTNLQIDRLYEFTREHYVEWYDLQTELVDHLASDIEGQWNDKPDIAFEKSLNKAFKRFGIFGFDDVVQQKQKAIKKMYRAFIWRFYKEWLKLPKIILNVVLMFVLYFSIEKSGIGLYSIIPFFVVEALIIRYSYKRIKQFKIRGHIEHKFLLNEVLKQYSMVILLMCVNIQIYLPLYFLHFFNVDLASVIVSVTVIQFFFIARTLTEKLPVFMGHKIKEYYPQYI